MLDGKFSIYCNIFIETWKLPIFGFLANLCNSTIIEIYSDIIRVSHGFDCCQMLEYIADL